MATESDLDEAARRLIPHMTAIAVIQPRTERTERRDRGRGILACVHCGTPLRDHPFTGDCSRKAR